MRQHLPDELSLSERCDECEKDIDIIAPLPKRACSSTFSTTTIMITSKEKSDDFTLKLFRAE